MIEILSTGAPNSVQDPGRFGYLGAGVSQCGAMDRPALLLGNALLGNRENDAGLEIVLFPFKLRFHDQRHFALTGADCRASLDGKLLPPNWVGFASSGQTLVLNRPERGARAYITFAGGVDVPLLMGSRATDLKCAFGGFEGRGLNRGDRLGLGAGASTSSWAGFGALPIFTPSVEIIPLRVIAAAEHDLFVNESLAAFYAEEWLVTPEANRMGYRLSGSPLRLIQAVELFSHGIVPGTVQVPPSGQPIIQLADANTCGGYPKIATVIEADLWRLAQAPPGARLRFVHCSHAEAASAMRDIREHIAGVRHFSIRRQTNA